MHRFTRRELLGISTLASLSLALSGCTPRLAAPDNDQDIKQPVTSEPSAQSSTAGSAKATGMVDTATAAPSRSAPTAAASAQSAYLAVVRGEDAAAITERAISAIGGMERFVKTGYDVIIKPNICNANHGPEYASTTNPEVIAALVRLCLGAGAKRVRVMDYPFDGSPQAAYARSGIEAAVTAVGGMMEVMAPMGFIDTAIPDGVDIKNWPVYQPALEADLLINVPIAKNHGLARLTLGGKNLMGLIENRGGIHRNLGQRISDLTSLIKPQLTVIDAVRILMENGPTGGDLSDVKQANTIIASHDLVACDAYATSLFGLKPDDISYIRASAERGLGQADLSQVRVEELAL